MGAPTKAFLVKLWMSGQNGQQPDQPYNAQLPSTSSPDVVQALPPGSPEKIEALPPGAPSMKEEQARKVRAYARLNLTRDALKGDEESKQKV